MTYVTLGCYIAYEITEQLHHCGKFFQSDVDKNTKYEQMGAQKHS